MTTIEAPPRIRTERLNLRPPELADVDRIHELAADWDVVRMTTRMPWPYRREDALDFVRRVRASRSEDAYTFVIEGADGPAGLIGFFTEAGQRLPEIGYWLGRPYWGRGYATEAADAALRWAASAWGRRGVRSGHFADNDASGRVLCKTGFLYTGEVIPKMSRARGEITPTRMMVWLA
jgi:RimJ/RimL family protein N-acetyltransferase